MNVSIMHRHGNRSLEEAVSELEREFQVRERCYERWIADGKLDLITAKDRMERLAAAICILKEPTAGIRTSTD
jgi:hypothetical protein